MRNRNTFRALDSIGRKMFMYEQLEYKKMLKLPAGSLRRRIARDNCYQAGINRIRLANSLRTLAVSEDLPYMIIL